MFAGMAGLSRFRHNGLELPEVEGNPEGLHIVVVDHHVYDERRNNHPSGNKGSNIGQSRRNRGGLGVMRSMSAALMNGRSSIRRNISYGNTDATHISHGRYIPDGSGEEARRPHAGGRDRSPRQAHLHPHRRLDPRGAQRHGSRLLLVVDSEPERLDIAVGHHGDEDREPPDQSAEADVHPDARFVRLQCLAVHVTRELVVHARQVEH